MKIRDLEKLLNERLEKEGYKSIEKQTYFDDIAVVCGGFLKEILEELGGKLQIKSCYSERNYCRCYLEGIPYESIILKVRRKQGGRDRNYLWSCQKYYVNDVELGWQTKDDTTDEIFDYLLDLYNAQEQGKKDRVNEVIKFMEEKNITYKEMEEMADLFRRYSYRIEEELGE